MLLTNWLRCLNVGRLRRRSIRSRKRQGSRPTATDAAEALERRILLSAPSVHLQSTGKLIITATADDDTAVVSLEDPTTVRVFVQTADTTFDQNFNRADVRKIVFYGQEGDDSFLNDTDVDSSAFGGDGHDTLTGGSGDDLIKGQIDNDVLDGRGGRDTIKGLAGRDTLWGGDGDDVLIAGGGRDSLRGGAGNDDLRAQGGSREFVDGEEGNDTVDGGAGDDCLSGGSGDDLIRGRTGSDRLIETADVDFLLLDDRLTGLGADTIEGIKLAHLTGGPGHNAIDVTGFNGEATLIGGGGDDTLVGSSKADSLVGGPGRDFLNGRSGRDTLLGGGGNDTLFGGAGVDFLDAGAGDDRADGQGGDADAVMGGEGDDSLYGGAGHDSLFGGDGNDWLYGDDGDDLLDGGSEQDILQGGAGDDTLNGNADRDLLIGGGGRDNLDGGWHDDILIGSTTDFDADPYGLSRIMTVWCGAAGYNSRTSTLEDADDSAYYLQSGQTVRDDGEVDTLEGRDGSDWFFQPPPFGPEFDVLLDLDAGDGETQNTFDAVTGTPNRNQVVWPPAESAGPAYLSSINDPTFGTPITRITDDAGNPLHTVFNTGGEAVQSWSNTLRNRYVTDSAWSSDGSLIHLRSYDVDNPYQLVLNGSTYETEFVAMLPSTNFRWSQDPSRPNIQYSLVQRENTTDEDDLIYEYDVTTGTITRTITLPFHKRYSGKETIAFVDGKQYVAMLGVDKAAPEMGIGLYVVDLDYVEGAEQPVVASFPLSDADCGHATGPCSAVNLNSLTYSPDGRYALVMYDGPDVSLSSWRLLDVDLAGGLISPHSMPDPPNSPLAGLGDPDQGHFAVNWSHPTFAYGSDGQTVYVVGSSGNWQRHEVPGVATLDGNRVGGLLAFNTSTNAYKSLTNPDNEANVAHVNATNVDNPGYVFATYSAMDGGTKYRGEIVAVHLDDPGDPEDGLIRLAHHRTNAANDCWQCQAHLVVNRSATQIIFSSTWGDDQSVVSTYVLDVTLT